MKLGALVLQSALSAVIGMLGALWVLSLKTPPAAGPPIALMDRKALFVALEAGHRDAPERRRRFEETARALSAEGYLVMDPGWVIAAPESLYVDPDQ